MNKSLLIGVVLGALGVTAGGAVAGYNMFNKGPEFADVIAVEPIAETVRTPREVCRDHTVTHRKPAKDTHQITGTVLGAVVGGVVGNQIGGGSGKKVATVAGAAAGGYAGNKVQENMQAKDVYTTTERRCETVVDTSERVVGYEVAYQLDGKPGTVRMNHKPGPRIPVRDGRLMDEEPTAL
jgi:uncharacterized protein YcfJ